MILGLFQFQFFQTFGNLEIDFGIKLKQTFLISYQYQYLTCYKTDLKHTVTILYIRDVV